MQLLKLRWVSVYNIVLDMDLINLTRQTLLTRNRYSARVNLYLLVMIMTLAPTTGFAESVAGLRSPAEVDRAIKTSDSTLLGLSGVELALGGSIVTTAAAGGYGLYQLARGGESVATIVATLIALEVASIAILTGFAIKFGVAGLYLWPTESDDLWPTESDDNGDPRFEPTRNHDRLPRTSPLHQALAVN